MFFIKPRVSGYPMISNFGYPVPELPDFAHHYYECCPVGLGGIGFLDTAVLLKKFHGIY